MLDDLLAALLRSSDRLALARLLTLIARGEQLRGDPRGASLPRPRRTPGSWPSPAAAGVGKSTLVGKLIEVLRRPGQDGGGAGLRSAESAHRRGAAGRSHPHAEPARRSGVFIRSLAAAERASRPSPSTSTS